MLEPRIHDIKIDQYAIGPQQTNSWNQIDKIKKIDRTSQRESERARRGGTSESLKNDWFLLHFKNR